MILHKSAFKLDTIIHIFLLGIIFYNLYLSASYAIRSEIILNTDVARDFLLVDDVVTNHKMALIGPRSGGISGIFHGPLWIYLHVPVFLASHGNPVAISWFWVFLMMCLTSFVYIVGEKMFDRTVGLLAGAIISVISILQVSSLLNPFGAVLFSPLFFYFAWRYSLDTHIKDLFYTIFFIGILIQFQIAFGGPMLILTTIYFMITKKKEFRKHMYAYVILLIPLSTYILFDLRHNFLQVHSLITYITTNHNESTQTFFNFLSDRLLACKYTIILVFSSTFLLAQFFLILSFILTIWEGITEKNNSVRHAYRIFSFLFLGYWLLTIFYKGTIWSYYVSPFLPLFALIIASQKKVLSKYIFYVSFIVIYLSLFFYISGNLSSSLKTLGTDTSSWIFNKKIAETIFQQHDKEFGYYVFSPDEYGYTPRYTMKYIQKSHLDQVSVPYEKKTITYLLISPPGGENNGIGGDWWKANRVNIKKTPEKAWKYKNGFRIEKFVLTKKEIDIPSDANLINDLIFR